jgi:hypothetical protein
MVQNYPPPYSTKYSQDKNMSSTQIFDTADNTVSYVSSSVHQSPYGNRSVVFQASLSAGDTVVLQARLMPSLPFVDVLTVTDSGAMHEVVLATEFRITVTNTSGDPVVAAMTL